jgi:hypothetical protein
VSWDDWRLDGKKGIILKTFAAVLCLSKYSSCISTRDKLLFEGVFDVSVGILLRLLSVCKW